MKSPVNRQVRLKSRPAGIPQAGHFEIVETPVPARPRPKMPAIRTWLLSRKSPRWFLLAAAVLVLGGSWLFLGILEDVISGDPLVTVDAFVHESIQSLRTPAVDRFMVAVTELGDVQVVLPVIMVVLGWFIALRLWRTAVYWLAAVGVAEALVKVIKLALHRQRPGALYVGAEQFSFPSGHATLSVVVYGFLAFLLASGAPQRLRVFIVSVAMVLIGAVASSRLYLGSHWMSDVLAGLSFGTAWIAALAVAYLYQRREHLRTGRLPAAVLATFAIAATFHIATSLAADLLRYAPALNGTLELVFPKQTSVGAGSFRVAIESGFCGFDLYAIRVGHSPRTEIGNKREVPDAVSS